MDYVKPLEVVKSMVAAGAAKSALRPKDLLIRGFLAGALLGFATSLAVTATFQTNAPIVGALIFPVGFVMIVLLGLDLVTGGFALMPLAGVDGQSRWSSIVRALGWVFLGNLIGSVLYGVLLWVSLTSFGADAPTGMALKLIAAAEAKTTGYAADGTAGFVTAFVKAVLCNWMVCLGVVMALVSHSTIGKIVAMWLPVLTFFAQGFEHLVVNLFVIPTGMMLGARVTLADWVAWNLVPVTLGNLVGGFLFTGLSLYWTYAPAKPAPPCNEPVAESPAAEPVRA